MTQRQIKIEGQLAACSTCGHQPHHYEIQGKHTHFLECSPCRMRTSAFSSLQEAVEAWENQNMHTWKEVG
jgi:hypothetical protein